MELLFLTGLSTTHPLHFRKRGVSCVIDSTTQSFNASCDTDMQVSIVQGCICCLGMNQIRSRGNLAMFVVMPKLISCVNHQSSLLWTQHCTSMSRLYQNRQQAYKVLVCTFCITTAGFCQLWQLIMFTSQPCLYCAWKERGQKLLGINGLTLLEKINHDFSCTDCFSQFQQLNMSERQTYCLFSSMISLLRIYMYICISHWKHISLKITLVLRLIKVSAQKSPFFCVSLNYPALCIMCTGSRN